MSRWEGVLIDTEESVEAVARIIKELIGASFTHDEDGDLVALFRRTAGAWLRNADFEDEPGLPLNSYRYALLIHDIDRSGTHYYAIQEHCSPCLRRARGQDDMAPVAAVR